MGIETEDQAHSTDTGNKVKPGAHSVSATEHLAQLTLDSLPGWMKASGGIQRFRLVLLVVIVTGTIILGVLIFRQASKVDAVISAPHRAM